MGYFLAMSGSWLFFASPVLIAACLVKPSSMGFKSRMQGVQYYSSLIGVGFFLAVIGVNTVKGYKVASPAELLSAFLGLGAATLVLVEPKNKLLIKVTEITPRKLISSSQVSGVDKCDPELIHQLLAEIKKAGQLTVVDAVIATKRDIKEVENHLQALSREGYITMDNDPETGKITYRL